MSKSPYKDFSRLIETAAKTAKKEQSKIGGILPSQPPKFDTHNIIGQLKSKLEVALRNNTRLLDQNSSLGEMANQLKHQLRLTNDQLAVAQRQIEEVHSKTAQERDNLTLQVELANRSHEQELTRLLREVSTLHDEKTAFEIERQRQIEKLKSQFQGSLLNQLQGMRNVQNNAKQLYETQIKNLKEALDAKETQIEAQKGSVRLEKERLLDDRRSLEKELKHLRVNQALEIQALKSSFKNQMHHLQIRVQHEKEIEVGNKEIRLKQLKKDLAQRTMELQHVSRRMNQNEEMSNVQNIQTKRENQLLLNELKSNDLQARTLLSKEKNRLEELAKLEVDNLTKLFETHIEELNGQNFKLKQLIQCKKQELRYFYEQNTRIKDSYGVEMGALKQKNEDLQNRIKALQLQKKQQTEMFKIKMTKLLENDIRTMGDFYQHQLTAYMDRVSKNEEIINGLKQRLYKSLSQNDQARRSYEVEAGKLRARVQDLKIKMANQHIEHKEHVSNLGSKIQLTSQTLIREAEHKEKTKGQYEEEKRKYHMLANAKDREIAQLMGLLQNMKRLHEDQIKNSRQQTSNLREQLQDSQRLLKRVREENAQQLKAKDEKMLSLQHSNEAELKQIRQLEDKVEVLEKNQLKYKKQYEHIQMINASITQELGLSKGFIENLQLQSNAAIEDERSKLKTFIRTHEIGIRDYYEAKIKTRDGDIDRFKRVIFQKEEDIRQLIVKYNALEQRFDLMMESNKKLTEFEEKVRSLGLDQNLIKNMGELFRKSS